MTPWNHIILEAFCARKWSCKKDEYYHKLEGDGSFTKIKNKGFDSKYRTPRKPSYCKNVPQYVCLEKDCPHLAYANVDKEDYDLFMNVWKKKVKASD